MNLKYRCGNCQSANSVEGFNPAYQILTCCACGDPNGIVDAVRRGYGFEKGQRVARILTALRDALDDSRSGDCRKTIEMASAGINQVLAGA